MTRNGKARRFTTMTTMTAFDWPKLHRRSKCSRLSGRRNSLRCRKHLDGTDIDVSRVYFFMYELWLQPGDSGSSLAVACSGRWWCTFVDGPAYRRFCLWATQSFSGRSDVMWCVCISVNVFCHQCGVVFMFWLWYLRVFLECVVSWCTGRVILFVYWVYYVFVQQELKPILCELRQSSWTTQGYCLEMLQVLKKTTSSKPMPSASMLSAAKRVLGVNFLVFLLFSIFHFFLNRLHLPLMMF